MSKKHVAQPVDGDIEFASAEEKLLEEWYKKGIIDDYLHKNDHSDKRFSFLDGPITANNPMGVHHGWGRTYKDIWQKYFNLKGYKQRFQNGFDCQGLWVEVEVEKDLEFHNKQDIEKYGVEKFVNLCKKRVLKYALIQTQQSKRLGYFMDWDNSYYTMSDENNYMIWHFLKICHENGWIYKGKDSVPWCPRCQTAISQHEMLTEDYKEVVHKAIYLALPLVGRDNERIMIWTTTPWTIPANIAVAVDEDMDYSLVVGESGDNFWVAKDTVKRIFGHDAKIEKTIKGRELVGIKYEGPFDHLPAVQAVAEENPNNFHRIVATDTRILPISSDEGTGMVHTAVSAGSEDYKLGQKLGLPMIPVIDDEASYIEGFDFLSGKNAKKHPEIVLDYLSAGGDRDDVNWVYEIENFKHRYPACWRCKTELVWIVKNEWYISMDQPGKSSKNKKTLRQRMKIVARKINWLPTFGLDRELDWLTNMHDWMISKPNRYWGLALPIYECDQCGNFEVIGSKEELQEMAVEGWDKLEGKTPHKPQIDAVKIKCSKCGEVVSRIGDVGNVWLDAGIVPFSTYTDPDSGKLSYTSDKKYWSEWFPADFITESFPGQFKNWFYSMIAMSTVLEDSNPFKTVLGYASVLAEDGRAMHKSWGNTIEFNEGAKKMSVDVMRWLYARQNPVKNLPFGYNTAAETKRRVILILWNSYRFFANATSSDEWSATSDIPNSDDPLDRWILSRLYSTVKNAQESLDKFDSLHAVRGYEEFIKDLSTWYIRRSRDRFGSSATSEAKQNAYSTMHYVLSTLAVVISPIIPFISDRIYTNVTGNKSVHLANWPDIPKSFHDKELEHEMMAVRAIAEKGHAVRKELGIRVRQPLASLTTVSSTKIPEDLHPLIEQELNVKKVKTTTIKKSLTYSVKTNNVDDSVEFETKLTPELEAEGTARDIMRSIQKARKSSGLNPDQTVRVILPSWPVEHEDWIKTRVNASELVKGQELSVEVLA